MFVKFGFGVGFVDLEWCLKWWFMMVLGLVIMWVCRNGWNIDVGGWGK